MKKLMLVLVVFALLVIPSSALANKPDRCATIQSGTITDSADNPLAVGYDQWGYNYQAHMFNGLYWNYNRPDPPCEPGTCASDTYLIMKWNDAWLSNKDCDEDGKLDRHYGFDTYIGSGAWETNHQWGEYELDGETCKWNYFVKIVAVPDDAVPTNGIWYTADEIEIGPVIWGAFAIIQQVYNDPCEGAHGVEYLSPAGPGFGKWK